MRLSRIFQQKAQYKNVAAISPMSQDMDYSWISIEQAVKKYHVTAEQIFELEAAGKLCRGPNVAMKDYGEIFRYSESQISKLFSRRDHVVERKSFYVNAGLSAMIGAVASQTVDVSTWNTTFNVSNRDAIIESAIADKIDSFGRKYGIPNLFLSVDATILTDMNKLNQITASEKGVYVSLRPTKLYDVVKGCNFSLFGDNSLNTHKKIRLFKKNMQKYLNSNVKTSRKILVL